MDQLSADRAAQAYVRAQVRTVRLGQADSAGGGPVQHSLGSHEGDPAKSPGRRSAEKPRANHPRGKAGGADSPRWRVVPSATELGLPVNAEVGERRSTMNPPARRQILKWREKELL